MPQQSEDLRHGSVLNEIAEIFSGHAMPSRDAPDQQWKLNSYRDNVRPLISEMWRRGADLLSNEFGGVTDRFHVVPSHEIAALLATDHGFHPAHVCNLLSKSMIEFLRRPMRDLLENPGPMEKQLLGYREDHAMHPRIRATIDETLKSALDNAVGVSWKFVQVSPAVFWNQSRLEDAQRLPNGEELDSLVPSALNLAHALATENFPIFARVTRMLNPERGKTRQALPGDTMEGYWPQDFSIFRSSSIRVGMTFSQKYLDALRVVANEPLDFTGPQIGCVAAIAEAPSGASVMSELRRWIRTLSHIHLRPAVLKWQREYY